MATGGFAAGISGMSAAVEGFRAATAAGFAISAHGGQVLLDAIDEMAKAVEEVLTHKEVLSQEPLLGTTPAAEVYKPFLATIATDPVQGFIPVVLKFQEDLRELRSGVEQAMGLYRSTDGDRAQGLNAIGGTTRSA